MTTSIRALFVAVGILALVAIAVVDAQAQCCGQSAVAFAQPTTTFYQPATFYQPTTTFYQPVAVQAYRPADTWYPGRWLGELNRRIWGVDQRYAVATPVTFAPTYTASYAPVQTVAFSAPVTMSAPSCSACTTCAMPVTSSCDSCGVATVTQTSFESTGCAGCAVGASSYETQPAAPSTASPPPSTYDTNAPDEAPGISPSSNVPMARPQEAQRPATDGATEPPAGESSVLEKKTDANTAPSAVETPASGSAPATDTTPATGATPSNGAPPAAGTGANSAVLEAPPLFFPSDMDRSAQRSTAPVRTAVLHRPTSQATLTTTKISWQQAQQDAAGWTSAAE